MRRRRRIRPSPIFLMSTPNIPIRNLYWILCYAWDVLEEAEAVDVGRLDGLGIQDLLAQVLARGVRHVMRRGLDRDYVTFREDTPALRGKINVAETATRLLERHAKAHVEYDELSADIPSNQVLKAALLSLLRVRNLDVESKDQVAAAYHLLGGVSQKRLSPDLFRAVRLHRNNRFYRLLMEICRLVYECLVPDERGESSHFRDFTRDEHRMRMLFEGFVRNFYRRHQTAFRVDRNQMAWQDAISTVAGPGGLPTLNTDISLTNTEEVFVIDTKYTLRAFGSNQGGALKLNSDHLYQLWAYVTNYACREAGARRIRGLLLYPTDGESFQSEWMIQGNRVGASGINLNQEWHVIRSELLEVIFHAPELSRL